MDVSALFASPTFWIISGLVYLLYRYATSTFNYFSDQGIPGPKPVPLFGNVWGFWNENVPIYDKEIVKKYGRTLGCFDGLIPNLWTTDVNLIKSVLIKDFDHFINRREFIVQLKYTRRMVTMIRDQIWKDIRSSITPAFTSGKIKRMSVIITECTDRLVEKFQKIVENGEKLDAKKHFSTFTMDVIARCAFGMTFENLGQDDDPFMENAIKVFRPTIFKSPLVLLPVVFPNLLNKFAERAMFGGMTYFINILEDAVQQRRASKVEYHDFIEVAREAIAEYTREVDGKQVPMWNEEEVDEIVIAQSAVFLLAGFDTTAATLTNAIYLLSKHPEVQQKLYEEVTIKYEKHGEVNHEMIADTPYVDHVIHEVIRMYPPLPRIERLCNKDVTYKGVHIKKGTIVTVPSFALHYDEEYYPDPLTFNPDRWNPESEIKPNPYAFMPFGLGPRNCVGMRFAMEEMKIALCALTKHFRFFPVAETPDKLEFENGFLLVAQPIFATVGIEAR